ncbi:sn-glycerol-1-phosphate dehydrogenase [Caldibacillus thermoamylovorans]|uniref:Glycerol-1-phosphate dehydrogenase n=1 Tax=Caldibacillus thermoamylovorans TaxID=35841 RepID=A0ABD4A6H1_9BACI|nr:sn-glycerol-1-phosphate dehydrogenase [Caldibacillus thermoamylovorans]KIO64135.1 Glycerol-1-phosphate dehydrogenase [Caldibacillus thermoamylovorans]KIO72755.1 Glycerol-1-phosphate dehydrogenase [Caldibacillus thermoamylovorans]
MDIYTDIKRLASQLKISNFSIPEIRVEKNAILHIRELIKRKQWKNIVVVYDQNTYLAAGEKLIKFLMNDFEEVIGININENEHGQVIANEESLVQVFIKTPNDADVLIAVGSGTIHDIVRFAGHKMNIPFISVPTAASVDGFTSKGAPLILRGVKQTIQTAAPIAVFADIDVIKAAPREMAAAGFGDILGKYTSLLDWEISKLVGNEPFHEGAASLTRKALETCVEYVEEISNADEKGITILMNALIESGLVMQILDYSRPASGAEHHLSHYWEMYLLKTNQKQLLHGAKVGVATTMIVELYKKNWKKLLRSERIKNTVYGNGIEQYGEYIFSVIEKLPFPDELKKLLEKVGGPTTVEELGIPQEIVIESLNEAHHLRDRCTGLLLLNQIKETPIRL